MNIPYRINKITDKFSEPLEWANYYIEFYEANFANRWPNIKIMKRSDYEILSEWCQENLSGEYYITKPDSFGIMGSFIPELFIELDEDMMMFKLRW